MPLFTLTLRLRPPFPFLTSTEHVAYLALEMAHFLSHTATGLFPRLPCWSGKAFPPPGNHSGMADKLLTRTSLFISPGVLASWAFIYLQRLSFSNENKYLDTTLFFFLSCIWNICSILPAVQVAKTFSPWLETGFHFRWLQWIKIYTNLILKVFSGLLTQSLWRQRNSWISDMLAKSISFFW